MNRKQRRAEAKEKGELTKEKGAAVHYSFQNQKIQIRRNVNSLKHQDILTPFIVKVQISDKGNAGCRMLIYNEDRSIFWEDEFSDDMAPHFKYRGGMFKQFYNVTVKDGKFDLLNAQLAKWQDW